MSSRLHRAHIEPSLPPAALESYVGLRVGGDRPSMGRIPSFGHCTPPVVRQTARQTARKATQNLLDRPFWLMGEPS